jgi:hypothetical protein
VDPEVEVQLKDDYIEVKLESPILLKDVFVSCDVEAEFSENFFDVIPTETTIIKLYPKRLVIPKVELKSLNQFLPKY